MLSRRYMTALAVSGVAIALTIAVPVARGRPYLASAGAVFLAAWSGGVGPALLSTVVTAVSITAFLIATGPPWGVVEVVQAAVYVGVGLVITSFARRQRRSDLEVRRQGSRLEAMFRQASVGIAIADLDGTLTRLNPKLSALLGDATSPQSLRRVTAPDDWPYTAALLERLANGQVREAALEQRWLRADGSAVWVHVSLSSLTDTDGRPDGLIVVIDDVDERRTADDRLRVSENRYRSLVDASTAIVFTADPQGRFVPPQDSWEASTGQRADQYADWGWSMAIHADDRARTERLWREAVTAPAPVAIETRLWNVVASDYRWYAARAVPARDADGQVVEWIGAYTDIHERRLAELQLREREEALRRADREKDDFLALLAHELRNPLAPIRTAVQILKRRQPAGDDNARLHTVIDRQVQHMVRMVDDLLDVSRVLRGKVELRPESITLADIVAAALETSRPLLDAQHQQLRLDLPPATVTLWGDQVRLAQVVSNLLNNASKYSDEGDTVTVSAHVSDADLVLRVTDHGAGIAPELLPRIFEPFVQADRSLERSRGGLGIGLTLVRRIVELHGGQVHAASRGPGLGSQFEVRLPIAAAPAAAAVPRAATAPAVPTLPARVLVVDDNVDAADSIAVLLRDHGHAVQIAHNGIDALRDSAAWPPDVVILDIGLPGMSGYEVATMIRARGGHTPHLIAVTGYGQRDDARRAFAAGFEHHLVKPVDAEVLRASLADCLEKRRTAGTTDEPPR